MHSIFLFIMEYPFSYKRMSLRYEKRRIRVRHVVERVGALVLVACSLLVSSAWPDIGVRSYWAGVHIVWTVSVCRNRARTFGCSPMWRYASCCWRTCRCNTIPREFVETTTSERIRGIPSGETSPGRGVGRRPTSHRPIDIPRSSYAPFLTSFRSVCRGRFRGNARRTPSNRSTPENRLNP